jgi:hypothetical protein
MVTMFRVVVRALALRGTLVGLGRDGRGEWVED